MRNQKFQKGYGTSPVSHSLPGAEQSQNPEPVLLDHTEPQVLWEWGCVSFHTHSLRCREPREGSSGPGLQRGYMPRAQHWRRHPLWGAPSHRGSHPQGCVSTRSAPESEHLLKTCSLGALPSQRGVAWILRKRYRMSSEWLFLGLIYELESVSCDKWSWTRTSVICAEDGFCPQGWFSSLFLILFTSGK